MQRTPQYIHQRGCSVAETKEKAKNLCAFFVTNLTLKFHVNTLCKSARYDLHNISLPRRYLTKVSAKKAIHAFVMSRLDFYNYLLYELPSYIINKEKFGFASIIYPISSEMTVKFDDVAPQRDQNSCGLFAVAFATSLSNGNDPRKLVFDVPKMRLHLHQCL